MIGGGGLSTDWRWVQIQTSAYVDLGSGAADETKINAILVAARTVNDKGSLVGTGWNVDFWIDDLYLLEGPRPFPNRALTR